MLDTTPVAPRATAKRSRVSPLRLARVTRPSPGRRSTSLTETLAVGLGLDQR